MFRLVACGLVKRGKRQWEGMGKKIRVSPLPAHAKRCLQNRKQRGFCLSGTHGIYLARISHFNVWSCSPFRALSRDGFHPKAPLPLAICTGAAVFDGNSTMVIGLCLLTPETTADMI